MQVQVILHSYLREKLPPETGGRASLELPEGSQVADVFLQLDLPPHVAWTINNRLERDTSLTLQTGDELRVFRASAGG